MSVAEEARDVVELDVEAQQRAALPGGNGPRALQLSDVRARRRFREVVGDGVGYEVALVEDQFVATQVGIQDIRL